MSWRDISKKIIAKAIEEVGPDFDKISRNYYPFGDRKYHPYHIWLDEIARQRKEHQPKKDGQEELFPGGDSKYIIEALREQLETQAQVLAARDKIIVRVSRQLQDSTDQIKRLKCCGNCRNWLNRPDQMICTVQRFNASQWCYCEEWRRGWNDDGHQTGD